MSERILVTGGAGFIGHHFVEHIIKNTDWDVVVVDKLTYASGGFDRLRDIDVFDDKRVSIFTHDFTSPIKNGLAKEIGEVDYIVHMGAESHVDRSIEDPEPFVISNIVGTMRMLDFARTQKNLKLFNYFSTDEVHGSAPEGVSYKEEDAYNCTNPYAASKAGAEQLALAYENCYQVPVLITRTMNNFGERQHPEKFIPLIVRKVLAGETVTIHSDPSKTKAGKRHYIHARNASSALLFLIRELGRKKMWKGVREIVNIVGEKELDNLELAKFVADVIGKPLEYEMVDFHSSRPGHDLRYALDGSRLKEMGFKYPKTFEQSLEKTVKWMIDPERKKWLDLS